MQGPQEDRFAKSYAEDTNASKVVATEPVTTPHSHSLKRPAPPLSPCYSHCVKRSKLLFVTFVVLALLLVVAFYGAYFLLPTHNTAATHFDAIVVLGTPARPDG